MCKQCQDSEADRINYNLEPTVSFVEFGLREVTTGMFTFLNNCFAFFSKIC